MPENQSLKVQIISILDVLPIDSLRLLAEFALFLKAKMDWFTSPLEITPLDVHLPKQNPIRVVSPHLANPSEIDDFRLDISYDPI